MAKIIHLMAILKIFNVKKYGPLNLHARRLNHSDWFQIHLEDTNYKQLIRKTKLKNLK